MKSYIESHNSATEKGATEIWSNDWIRHVLETLTLSNPLGIHYMIDQERETMQM